MHPRLSWEDTFTSGKYQRTLELLNKVPSEQRSDVWKHNLYITEYCANNYTEEELLDKLSELDDIDNEAVISFNRAVLLFKMKQFRSSEEILEKIWSRYKTLSIRISGSVGLLLIELAILAKNPSKGKSVCDQLHSLIQSQEADEALKSNKDEPNLLSKLQLYRAKINSLVGNNSKDLKSVLSMCTKHSKENEIPSESWQLLNVNALTLKAKTFCQQGHFSKSLKQLSTCCDTNQLSPTLFAYYNNLACIHRSAGNPGLAKYNLIRALTCFEEIGQSTVNEHRVKTLYNLGLCILHEKNGDYETAIQCFEETRPLYYNRPRLWMRMAECCIQHYQKQKNLSPFSQYPLTRSNYTPVSYQGSTCGRRILLPLPTDDQVKEEVNSSLSLSNALIYLKNAHTLLKDTSDKNEQKIYYNVLICLAYVNLCTGCPNQTEKYCKELIQSISSSSQASSHFKIRANNYIAEALCMLGRAEEAVQSLDLSAGEIIDSSEDNRVCGNFTNLAAVYVLEKNISKAHLCLKAALSCNPNYTPALRLLAYLFLKLGKINEAMKLMRTNRGTPNII